MAFCAVGIGATLNCLPTIKTKIVRQNRSKTQGQRAVRALLWVLIGKWSDFDVTWRILTIYFALVEVEVNF
jgi:hypothetical protein